MKAVSNRSAKYAAIARVYSLVIRHKHTVMLMQQDGRHCCCCHCCCTSVGYPPASAFVQTSWSSWRLALKHKPLHARPKLCIMLTTPMRKHQLNGSTTSTPVSGMQRAWFDAEARRLHVSQRSSPTDAPTSYNQQTKWSAKSLHLFKGTQRSPLQLTHYNADIERLQTTIRNSDQLRSLQLAIKG